MVRKRNGSILKQIADETGVSVMTVSRAMSGRVAKYRSAQERTQRILALAARLNYRPSAAARTMVSGRSQAVCLLLPSAAGQSSVIFPGILDALHDELARHNYHLTIARLPGSEAIARGELPKALRETLADGFLVNYYGQLELAALRPIERLDEPVVWINFKRACDTVRPDDYGAGKEATRRLVDLGHRRIAYVRVWDQSHYSGLDRRRGYEAVMAQAGLVPQVLEFDRIADAERRARLLALLRGAKRPTAIVTYAVASSLAVLRITETLGLQSPRDLALIHLSGELTLPCGLALTGMQPPWYRIGQEAAVRLLSKIARPARRFPALAIPFVVQPGDTLAPPATAPE